MSSPKTVKLVTSNWVSVTIIPKENTLLLASSYSGYSCVFNIWKDNLNSLDEAEQDEVRPLIISAQKKGKIVVIYTDIIRGFTVFVSAIQCAAAKRGKKLKAPPAF